MSREILSVQWFEAGRFDDGGIIGGHIEKYSDGSFMISDYSDTCMRFAGKGYIDYEYFHGLLEIVISKNGDINSSSIEFKGEDLAEIKLRFSEAMDDIREYDRTFG